jgi:hypothetical protein
MRVLSGSGYFYPRFYPRSEFRNQDQAGAFLEELFVTAAMRRRRLDRFHVTSSNTWVYDSLLGLLSDDMLILDD